MSTAPLLMPPAPMVIARPVREIFQAFEQPTFDIQLSPLLAEEKHPLVISATLVGQSGDADILLPPRLRVHSTRQLNVKYSLDPLPSGLYTIAFSVDVPGNHSAAGSVALAEPLSFSISPTNSRHRRPRLHEGVPGNVTLLAEECLVSGQASRAEMLVMRALSRRPTDSEAWRIYSSIQEAKGNTALAYDSLNLSVSLAGTRASIKARTRLIDLAIASATEKAGPTPLPKRHRGLRLAFVAPYLSPPVGGAELSWHYLAHVARARGHKVTFVTDGSGPEAFDSAIATLRCRSAEQASLATCVADADIVLTQHDWAPEVVARAKHLGRPVVVFAQSYELICRRPWFLTQCDQPDGGCYCTASELARGHRALRDASLVFVASKYQATQVERLAGIIPEVFHQLLDPVRVVPHVAAPFKAIVMNQPDYHKGGLIVEELARRLPSETFVTVGYRNRDGSVIPNLFHLGSVGQRLLYSISDILLVPSIWPEPFGRVALEGQLAGVPVVATRTGGLGDVLGAGGLFVDDPMDIDAWVGHILRLKSDSKLRQTQVECGLAHSAKFDSITEALRVLQTIEEIAAHSYVT